jgi:hypothetical protein
MRYIFYILFILAACRSHAQSDLINRTVLRRDSNFLFRDEYNELVIVPYTPGKWQLTARFADVQKTDSPWLFIVQTMQKGTDTLRLLRNGVTVAQKLFRVIETPDLVLRLGVIRKDSATVSEVLANKKIVGFVPGCDCKWGIRIICFELELITNVFPGWKKAHKIDGNMLTPETTELIRQLKSGDKIIFKELRVITRNSRVRVHPGFTITIR